MNESLMSEIMRAVLCAVNIVLGLAILAMLAG